MLVNDFTVLPVSYPSCSTHHILYARRHNGSKRQGQNDWPAGRTLFLVNVPPDATERELTLLFKTHGVVERVSFDVHSSDLQNDMAESDSDDDEENMETDPDTVEEQPRKRRKLGKDKQKHPPKVIPLSTSPLRTLRKSGRTAHIVFLDSSSLDRSLAPPHKPRIWPTSEDEPYGLAHYAAQYAALRPPLDTVRAHADSAIELYEFELAKTKQQSKYHKGEAIVDEDGFTLVTRGGAYGKTLGGGIGVATKTFQETGETSTRKTKAKKDKEKPGLYGHQKAEKQRNDLLALKRGWEESKAKVEALKASRKFKPY